MFELVDYDDVNAIIGEYTTLQEARDAKKMYEDEHPENTYAIYKVIRTRVE